MSVQPIVRVVPPEPRWRAQFEREAEDIPAALGENLVGIHHIGSTSIPGIYAKPVIDMLVEVKTLLAVDLRSSAMETLGYEVMGEFGIAGRRYFRKDNSQGTRTHQIHTFEIGNAQTKRHLAFRDYLIAHPEAAREYSRLKQRLAAEHPNDMDAYIDGKDDFIQEIDRKAAEWRG